MVRFAHRICLNKTIAGLFVLFLSIAILRNFIDPVFTEAGLGMMRRQIALMLAGASAEPDWKMIGEVQAAAQGPVWRCASASGAMHLALDCAGLLVLAIVMLRRPSPRAGN
jgi:hypothetical protein